MKMKWNTVKYIDCMDVEEGLPSLPEKSIDLCLTDFPYGVKYDYDVWNDTEENLKEVLKSIPYI